MEVRVLRDYGTVRERRCRDFRNGCQRFCWHCLTALPCTRAQLFTRDGEIVLRARSVHYLWRDEAQPLIAEGVLAKVSDA